MPVVGSKEAVLQLPGCCERGSAWRVLVRHCCNNWVVRLVPTLCQRLVQGQNTVPRLLRFQRKYRIHTSAYHPLAITELPDLPGPDVEPAAARQLQQQQEQMALSWSWAALRLQVRGGASILACCVSGYSHSPQHQQSRHLTCKPRALGMKPRKCATAGGGCLAADTVPMGHCNSRCGPARCTDEGLHLHAGAHHASLGPRVLHNQNSTCIQHALLLTCSAGAQDMQWVDTLDFVWDSLPDGDKVGLASPFPPAPPSAACTPFVCGCHNRRGSCTLKAVPH